MCCITFEWGTGDADEKVKQFFKTRNISWAVIEVTTACNFNCQWCYVGKVKPKHMPKEQLFQLLKELKKAGVKQVTFSGGEPLLYPHLKDAMKFAKDLGLVIHMNTNGYLFTEETAKELKSLGLSQIEVNLDSLDRKKHDEVRGKEGAFERAILAFKNAKKAGITCVSHTVLTKENEDEILDIIKFVRNLGVERCRIWDMMLSGSAKDKKHLLPTRYLELLKEISRFAKKTGAVRIEAGEPLFPLDFDPELPVVDSWCVCARGLLINIAVDGDVYFCCTFRKSLYNIFDAIKNKKDLAEWHRLMLKRFLQRYKPAKRCLTCEFWEKCRGGCLTRSGYTEDGVDYWCTKNKNT